MRIISGSRSRLPVCALAALVLSAQQQQPPQPGSNTDAAMVTFKSQTALGIETVTVKDKNGKTIEGLTAKDSPVNEDGAPQTIQFCDFQKLSEALPGFSARPDAAPADPDAATKPKVAPATKTQIAVEAPGDIKFRDRRLLVIYFDMSAMPVPDQLRSF